jgi:hypothetical protein
VGGHVTDGQAFRDVDTVNTKKYFKILTF